jgi:hypothetical protein
VRYTARRSDALPADRRDEEARIQAISAFPKLTRAVVAHAPALMENRAMPVTHYPADAPIVRKERHEALVLPEPAPVPAHAPVPVAGAPEGVTVTEEDCSFIAEIIGETLSLVRRDIRDDFQKRDEKIRELEMEIARLRGSVDVLQRGGRAMRVRGTYDEKADYRMFDVVALGGSSFISLEDRPGPCPGENWPTPRIGR